VGKRLTEPRETPTGTAMRIVLVSPEYPTEASSGGIGTNTAATARGLARRGVPTTVVTRGTGAPTADGGVTVVRVPPRWLPLRAVEALWARRRIAAAVARSRPDVVQAPEWEGDAWWLARRGRVPVVTRLATPTYILDELNHGAPRRETRLVRWLERDQARRSAAVFAPTRTIADRVAADWRLPAVEVIPNPIDVAELERLGASGPPLEVPPRSIVFIGRLERRKGIHTLGAALAQVLPRHADVHALLIGRDAGADGGGATAELLESVRPVADRVHLLGELPRAEALAVVARAAVVVLPSLWESFGYVCAEAMALGRPVVASRTGGFAELVDEGRTGWLVPPGEVEELARALEEALSDPERLEAFGAAGRERAARYDVDRIAVRLLELYDEARASGAGTFGEELYERGYRRFFRADDRRDPFHRLYEQKRRAVLAAIPAEPRLRVLDVGGGYGRLAGPLAAHHEVVLADVSPEMLEEARRRWPELELVQADARALPFDDASFDLVLAIDLVTHLPSLDEGVKELARVVRPGGRVLFDTTNRSPWWTPAYPRYVDFRPKRLLLTMRSGGVLPEWRALVRHHRPGEARAAIAAAGLREREVGELGPFWSPKWHLWMTEKP
jgi:glycogen synthase